MKSEFLQWRPENVDANETGEESSRVARRWNCETQTFKPLDFNYILLTCTCSLDRQPSSNDPQLSLEFASTGRIFDEKNRMIFTVIPDGKPHTYLIPVGCSPAWSWRLNIDRLRITGSKRLSISKPDTVLWFIDELKSLGEDVEKTLKGNDILNLK